MKKVIYDSWIARNLLFKGYSTITLTAFVFTRYKSKEEMSQYVRNHECTYARQWAEMFLLGFFVVFVLQIPFDISSWWYLLPFFAFYIWYCWKSRYVQSLFGVTVTDTWHLSAKRGKISTTHVLRKWQLL